MPRPSTYHDAVIDYIHRERGPFSLSQVRMATGIKDPKTARVIVNRLSAMKYVTYLTMKIYGNKRWVVTKKWPPYDDGAASVKKDYEYAQVLRRLHS